MVLIGSNNPSWAHSKEIVLGAKTRFNFLEGIIRMPRDYIDSSHHACNCCNMVIHSWTILIMWMIPLINPLFS